METKIKTLGRLYAKSFFVELDEVGRPGGETATRLAVRHPSAVVVIPELDRGDTLVVFQHRYALGAETMEFPAGKIDPGEDPLTTARRELAEETGHEADEFELLLPFAPSAGYSDEIIHIFRACGLKPSKNPPVEHEIQRVERLPLARLKDMVVEGRLIDGTTMLALAVYEWKKGPLGDR